MSGWAAYQDHVYAQEHAEKLKRRIAELEDERDLLAHQLEQAEHLAAENGRLAQSHWDRAERYREALTRIATAAAPAEYLREIALDAYAVEPAPAEAKGADPGVR